VRLVAIIGGLSAFGPLSIDMYLPALPSLARELGATVAEGQLTLTACVLGLALGQVFVGPLSDARGRRGPLLVGLISYTVAALLCALAPSAPLLIGLRFAQGVAGAAGVVIARAIVRDFYSGVEIARFFALTMLVTGLAPILAPVVGGQLLLVTTWRGVFVVLALIGAGLVVVAGRGLPESLPAERRHGGGVGATLATFRMLLTDRTLVGYGLSGGLAFAAMFAYISGSPFVLEGIYGVSPQQFSLIFGANALGIVTTGQISARLVGRFGPRRLLAGGLGTVVLGSLVLCAAVISGVGLVGVLPALFLTVASVGLIGPNAAALALADHPRTAGSASALLGVLQFVIGGVVGPLVGVAGTGTALPMALIIAGCGSGAVLAFALLTRGRAARSPA
jgi:DHA1 family bicyclomycin/chloramphenicol resistance-like MFS transporter